VAVRLRARRQHPDGGDESAVRGANGCPLRPVDAAQLRRTAAGLAVIPALAVLAPVAGSASVVAMAHLADDASLRPGARACLAACHTPVRRRPLALMNLALLTTAALLVSQAPLLGLATLPGCVLFVVWRNTTAMLAASPPPH